MGSTDLLLPEGIEELVDCPFPLFDHIQRGLLILGWEEMPRDERPDRTIWDDDEALVAHFERVDADRERKYGSGGSSAIEDPVDNYAAQMLIAE
jgi:hypothetical protein